MVGERSGAHAFPRMQRHTMAIIPESERQHLAQLYDFGHRPRHRTASTSSNSPDSTGSSRDSSETRYKQIRKQSSPAYLSAGSSHYPATAKSTPSPVRSPVSLTSSNGHHRRSQSVRVPGGRYKANKPAPLNLDLLSLDAALTRPRASSTFVDKGQDDAAGLYRLRNFEVTSKGVVNRGDSYRAKSYSSLNTPVHNGTFMEFPRGERLSVSSAYSTGETSLSGETNSPQNPRYRVLMLGAPGVGKSALTNQFLTSEYMNAYETSFTDDEMTTEKSVSVLLDAVESELDFIDPDPTASYMDDKLWESNPVDAHVIVYSVADRSSFEKAIDILFELKQSEVTKHQAIILVGNKSDLVRARIVSKDEGKSIAASYDCKFTETSAGLNHQVDELLVGILSQIRLKEKQSAKKNKNRKVLKYKGRAKEKRSLTSSYEKAMGLLSKLLSRNSLSKSCGNLHVL
ncbi:GTP-binding protein REM 2-like isoform X2 [Paramacrobiotus metropolitanus]|uniref:GTP-binding protein REM 2-like isoform X2 n=1 Tax=Paramacrobiotus metropolitanus TaxID=2943436 RepID=UPI00244656EE|nr:GTP-binding protein REM 2-like isoform X2 [Paramacrobiotus metropolitanus]